MSRRSTGWWRSTAARGTASLSLAAGLALFPLLPASGAQSAGQAGESAAKDSLRWAKDGFEANVAEPMTKDTRAMTSVDGVSTQFAGALASPSSSKMLEVLIQPGATQDLTLLRVYQDTTFDGNYDNTYTFPFPVSGVCANGVLSCTPGTWADCTSYKWTAGGNGLATLAPNPLSGQDGLGGCYCINASCGSNLVLTNLALVLKDLGAGAVGAVQQAKPNWMVTEVSVAPPQIFYYGQDTTGARYTDGAGNTVSGDVDTQVGYYRDPAGLQGEGEARGFADAQNPTSTFSKIQGLSAMTGDKQYRTCDLRRDLAIEAIDLEQVVRVTTQGTGAWSPGGGAGNRYVDWVIGNAALGLPDDSCTEWTWTVFVERPAYLTGAWLTYAQTDDHLLLSLEAPSHPGATVYGLPYATAWGACTTARGDIDLGFGNGSATPNQDLLPYFDEAGSVVVSVRQFVGENGEGQANLRLTYSTDCLETDNLDDRCAVYDADTTCRLQDEKVDGVQTLLNGNSTRLVPLASKKTLGTGFCAKDYERDWWLKERTYICETAGAFDLSGAQRRASAVASSVIPQERAGQDFTYTDQYKDPATGQWVTTQGNSIALADPGSAPGCRQACKTVVTVTGTEAGTNGPRTEQTVAPDAKDFRYYECVASGNSFTCPAPPGETVLKPCQCLDEFAEAASIVKGLEAAGKDIICSSGVKR